MRIVRLGSVAAIAGVTLWGVGWISGLGSGWIHALAVPGNVTTILSVTTMTGRLLDFLSGGLGLPAGIFTDVLRFAGSVAIPVLAAWIGLRRPTGDRRSAVASAGLVVFAASALAVSVHLWYLLWALPFVAALRLESRAMQCFVAASLVGALVAPLDSTWHAAYLALIGGAALIAVLLGMLLVTGQGRLTLAQIARPAEAVPTPVG